jgi:hypothetical protein
MFYRGLGALLLTRVHGCLNASELILTMGVLTDKIPLVAAYLLDLPAWLDRMPQ